MQRLLLLILTVLAGLLPAAAAHAWWQPDWQYRKQITIDATPQGAAVAGQVGRVPLLVRLHTGNFTFDGINERGADLRFVGADDQTPLHFQIESFDALLGMALVWVDVPAVEGGQRQDIWMYYGNDQAPSGSNGQLTFDPNYTLVYHFDGAEGAPPRDTTAYGNNAQTTVGSVDGVMGRAAQFSGTPLMLPTSPSLAVPAGGAFTFSASVRPEQIAGDQLIYARRDAGNSLLIGVSEGMLFVEINGQRTSGTQPITAADWQKIDVTADGQQVNLYVRGQLAGSVAAALPPLNTVATLGGDVPVVPRPFVEEGAAPVSAASAYRPFVGGMDEVRLSKVSRPAGLLLAEAMAQGADSRLVVLGADEQQTGKSHFAFILSAMPIDAWVVVVILGLMMVVSWIIMIGKGRSYSAMAWANAAFMGYFREAAGEPLNELESSKRVPEEVKADSSLWRLYEVAVGEMRRRHERGYDLSAVSDATISAIRAAMDGVAVRENERMSKRMNWLSTTIEGAPYVGLLGTVLGIMLVFVVAAMAGAVDINSVAPGMAAALLCTAAGLGVAIPALFGYNWLASRSDAIDADMAVFVDEFVTRLAEEQGEGRRPTQGVGAPAAHGDASSTGAVSGGSNGWVTPPVQVTA